MIITNQSLQLQVQVYDPCEPLSQVQVQGPVEQVPLLTMGVPDLKGLAVGSEASNPDVFILGTDGMALCASSTSQQYM